MHAQLQLGSKSPSSDKDKRKAAEAHQTAVTVRTMLDSVPKELLSRAALQIRAYTRALRYVYMVRGCIVCMHVCMSFFHPHAYINKGGIRRHMIRGCTLISDGWDIEGR